MTGETKTAARPAVDFTVPRSELRRIVEHALAEDVGPGDITTEALVPADLAARGQFRVKGNGVIAGLPVVEAVFDVLDPSVAVTRLMADGSRVKPGDVIAEVAGPARSLLTGERVALNFLQRLSGIASTAAQYVEAVKGTQARIVDTRKTTPGIRPLEKWAVRAGGACNHRYNLADAVLVKDNHLVALRRQGVGLAGALKLARERIPHTMRIEVEVDRIDQVPAALEGGADIILLDNMSLEEMRQAVELIAGRALVEASGGIRLETVRSIAETGVDLISSGAITHSATSLDISLDFEL